MLNINSNNYLLDWIENLQSKGRITFCYQEVIDGFPRRSENAITLSLARVSQKGRIVPVYKGFYLIVPVEYASQEILPPILFIDYLMEFLSKPYYVGLLSAAALYGAAHQQPQEFYVITNTKQFSTEKKGIKINYTIKRAIPIQFLENRKTETGYVKVSSPELTAFDLVYYNNRIGGINRSCNVLNELSESMVSAKIGPDLLKLFSTATIQRLGYILGNVLNEMSLAERIWDVSQDLGLKFFRQPLSTNKNISGYKTDSMWKIIINTIIDIDE